MDEPLHWKRTILKMVYLLAQIMHLKNETNFSSKAGQMNTMPQLWMSHCGGETVDLCTNPK
jgi:hypothetical protein